MAILKVFKNSKGDSTYVAKNGDYIVFSNGRLETADAELISELEQEIRKGHPYFYVDPQDSEVDTSLTDAIKQATAEAVAGVMAKFGKAAVSSQAGIISRDQLSQVQPQLVTKSGMENTVQLNSTSFADVAGGIKTEGVQILAPTGPASIPSGALNALVSASQSNSPKA
jgi:septum formation topological specificity factor MinE